MGFAYGRSWGQIFHDITRPSSALAKNRGSFIISGWGRARFLAALSLLYGSILCLWILLDYVRLLDHDSSFRSLMWLGGLTIPLVYCLSRTKYYLLGSMVFSLYHFFGFFILISNHSTDCVLDTALRAQSMKVQIAFCILYMAIVINLFILPHFASTGFAVLSVVVGIGCSVFLFPSAVSIAGSSLFTLCILSFFSTMAAWVIHRGDASAHESRETFVGREGLYKNLLEHLPVAIFEINRDGHVCFVNKEACHTLKKPMQLPFPRIAHRRNHSLLPLSSPAQSISDREGANGQPELALLAALGASDTQAKASSFSNGATEARTYVNTANEGEKSNNNNNGNDSGGAVRNRSNSWSSSRPNLTAILGGPQGRSAENMGHLGDKNSQGRRSYPPSSISASDVASLLNSALNESSDHVVESKNVTGPEVSWNRETASLERNGATESAFSFLSMVSAEDREQVRKALSDCIEKSTPSENLYFTSTEEYGRRLYAYSFLPLCYARDRGGLQDLKLKRLDGRKLFKRNRAAIMDEAQKWKNANANDADNNPEADKGKQRRIFGAADKTDASISTASGKRKRPLKKTVTAKRISRGEAFAQGNVICYAVDVTDALRKVEFKKAKLQAEKETHTKGRFLANVSHELRTPLHGIIGMMDQLMDTKLDKEQTRYAKIMTSSAESLLQLVNDLLDLSKLEAGKLPLEVVHFDPAVVIQRVVNMIMVDIERKKLTLGVFIHDRIPNVVRGDPTRLQQVLLNLLSNSVKFTPKGGTIILKCSIRAGHILYFDVTDTGIGIRESAIPHLFSSFQQAETSTTRKFGGTGLGLAICKQICNQMGGSIGVESTYGKGSHFWFTVVLEAVFPKEVEPLFDFGNVDVSVRCNNPLIRDLLKNYVTMWQGVFLNDDVGVDVGGIGVVRTKPTTITPIAKDCIERAAEIKHVDGERTGEASTDRGLERPPRVGESEEDRRVTPLVDEKSGGDRISNTGDLEKRKLEEAKHGAIDAQPLRTTRPKERPYKWEIWVDMSPLEQEIVTNLMSKMNHHRSAIEEKEGKEKEKEKEQKEEKKDDTKPCVIRVDLNSPILRHQLLETLHEASRKHEEELGQKFVHKRIPTPDSEGSASVVTGGIGRALRKIKAVAMEEMMSSSTGDLKSPLGQTTKISVLLVEDNKINQSIAKRMLSRGGDGWTCEVDLAENGAEAVKSYMKKNYDVIFMDCNMPVMDGFAATRLIRGYEERMGGKDRTVVIAVTASAMEEDRKECLCSGMDDVLTKPFRSEALDATLRKWIQPLRKE